MANRYSQYQSEFTGEEIDARLRDSIQRADLSRDEYNALITSGRIERRRWYFIYNDAAKSYLTDIYIGRLHFATRGGTRPRGFPYVFPISF